MKVAAMVCSLLLILASCASQSKNVKLYAYKQAVSPGKRSGYETDENGKPLPQKTKARVNYFIYLSHPASLQIKTIEMWIDGDPFDIRAERVNSPVEIDDGNPFKSTKTVLVPKTKDSVWLLNPVEHNDRGTKNPIKTLAKANQLVVMYKLKGKSYSQSLKEIKPLPTAVMQ
jgi:hypothetical protein